MKVRTIIWKLMLLALLCVTAVAARAQSGNADFQQAVAAYQQSHHCGSREGHPDGGGDGQLPAIPEEARRHFVRGTALFKDAKSPDDYKQVVDEFRQAIRLAPWWPDARFNWALAREAAGDYANAIVNVNLYLLFKLPDADARAAQDKIYALEAKQEKAARPKYESTTQPAAPQENSFDALLRKINGRRYVHKLQGATLVLDVRNGVLVVGYMSDPPFQASRPAYKECARVTITGPEVTVPVDPQQYFRARVGAVGMRAMIGDGDSIVLASEIEDGRVFKDIFFWQR